VLVNDVGNINICDFGLSQLKLDMKRKSKDSGDVAGKGTMRWLSPERMQGGQLTWKCDVYSFGMVIYEVRSIYISMLTCRSTQRDQSHWITSMMPNSGKTSCVGYQCSGEDAADPVGGTRPSRPGRMPENLWQLTERCWAQESRLRPKFSTISKEIERMYSPKSNSRKDTSHAGMSIGQTSKLMPASTDSSENDTVWATASEGSSEQDQQYVRRYLQ